MQQISNKCLHAVWFRPSAANQLITASNAVADDIGMGVCAVLPGLHAYRKTSNRSRGLLLVQVT